MARDPPACPSFFFFNWSIVDLQCCVNFCCTAKWFSYTYIYIFPYSFPLWFITGYRIWLPGLYNRTLLFIHSIYNSLHLLIANSQSIPPPPPTPLVLSALQKLLLQLHLGCFLQQLSAHLLKACLSQVRRGWGTPNSEETELVNDAEEILRRH